MHDKDKKPYSLPPLWLRILLPALGCLVILLVAVYVAYPRLVALRDAGVAAVSVTPTPAPSPGLTK